MSAATRLAYLQSPGVFHWYAFDRVTVRKDGAPLLSLLGICFSEFTSGPNLRELTEVAADFCEDREGWYGLDSCRPLGWHGDAAVVSEVEKWQALIAR